MKQYQKIQTVFLRDPETKFKTLLEGQWAKPEFELLKDLNWVCTEKIDGTNIRVLWDGEKVCFGGKTENAQIPAHLLSALQELFSVEAMKACFEDAKEVCLYGEGYGKKIQRGGNYLPNGNDFILFDVKVGEFWLSRESVEAFARKLVINVVPVIGVMTLLEAVEMVKKGFKSTIAENKEYIAEGLIMKPVIELFNRRGERVISKVKYKDFLR